MWGVSLAGVEGEQSVSKTSVCVFPCNFIPLLASSTTYFPHLGSWTVRVEGRMENCFPLPLFHSTDFFVVVHRLLCEIISCTPWQHKQTQEHRIKQVTRRSRGHGSGSLQTQPRAANKRLRQNRKTNATKRNDVDKQASILILAVGHFSYLNQDWNNGNLSSVNIHSLGYIKAKNQSQSHYAGDEA